MKEPVRILHIVGAMYPGGMENFIMNLYRHIDRSRFQFDFCVNLQKKNDYSEEIRKLGGKVYVLPRLTRDPIGNLKEIRRIVSENHYQIVVRHTANALVAPQLLAAKHAGAVTICHSHNETDPQKFLHRCGKILMRRAADYRFACSPNAGTWMFGKQDFRVIKNAIDIEAFAWRPGRGDAIREEFQSQGAGKDFDVVSGCEESESGCGASCGAECGTERGAENPLQREHRHFYGNIANFIASKNHTYLLRIYREIVNRDPSALCFCIGEGDLRPQIEEEVRKLGLEDHVILTGIRNDIPDFMSALDVLIFPSKFEGLPLTLIEAQAAGLPSLISDTITKEVIVTEGVVEQMSIEEDPSVWAERAVGIAAAAAMNAMVSAISVTSTVSMASTTSMSSTTSMASTDSLASIQARACQYEKIAEAGYDIRQLAGWYEDFFGKVLGCS